jgi:hypothetical protein
VVDGDWPDADGQTLTERHEKPFVVTEATRTGLDPERWTLTSPPSGSREDLLLTFDRAVDHALAVRLIEVRDQHDRPVDGRAEVGAEGHQWRFRPERTWVDGTYTMVVQPELEDLAGNNLNGPLDRPLTELAGRRGAVRLQVDIGDP